jgi:hypothetical protein
MRNPREKLRLSRVDGEKPARSTVWRYLQKIWQHLDQSLQTNMDRDWDSPLPQ